MSALPLDATAPGAGTRVPAPMGLWTAIALVVGSMIGSGVFLLPAALASFGAASLIGWAITLGGALLLALVFSWLAASITRSGGPYAFAHEAFGDKVPFAGTGADQVPGQLAADALAVPDADRGAGLRPG